jgi:ribokinase
MWKRFHKNEDESGNAFTQVSQRGRTVMGGATIKDVAKRAGVSIATVSRVINGTGYASEVTRERVMEAVRALGFNPSQAARSLSAGLQGAETPLVADPRKTIVVFGSLNVDFVVRASRRPGAGETVPGTDFRIYPGGKGANQAVAASRAGGKVVMAGRIGDDVFSSVLTRSLLEAGVRGDHVRVSPNEPTGSAFIVIDGHGENSIVVVPGANGTVTREDVEALGPVLDSARILMLQLEVPLPVVEYAARKAREAGVTVMLDPAPPVTLPEGLRQAVDIITPNEHEAEFLIGRPVTDPESAKAAARDLMAWGIPRVVVKLGGKGLVYAVGDRAEYLPGYVVDVVDSTAAGDTFAGALAAAICEGRSFGDACRFANAAAAISVTRAGAQTSMPWRDEIDRFLAAKQCESH